MPIQITCGNCSKRMRVADKYAGRTVGCPGCKSPLSVPASSDVDAIEVEIVEEKFALACDSCGAQLQLTERFRGKRVKCPKCQHVLAVPPAASSAVAAAPPPPRVASPPAESAQWHVHAHDGQHYGPVSKSDLDQWVEEGLITATCQLSCDTRTWQAASEVYPELDDDGAFFPEGYQPMLRLRSEGASIISKAIVSDLKHSPRGNRITRAQYFQVGESRSLWDRVKAGSIIGPFAQEKEIDIDRLHLVTISDPAGEIHLVAPTDSGALCPTEFISVLPGEMPTSLALLRGEGGNWGIEASNTAAGVFLPQAIRSGMSKVGGQSQSHWDVLDDDEPKTAAQFANQFGALREGLRFDGKVSMGPVETTYNLDWIAQILPLSEEEYLLVAQYIPQNKMFGMDVGASWFVNWRAQFLEMAEQMPPEGEGCFCCWDYGNWGLVAYELLQLDVFE